MQVTGGATNVTTYFALRKTSDGKAATGLTITGFDIQYTRSGVAPTAKVDATALAATDSAHADNKAIEIDATDQPGLYRVDWPDAAFAAGVPEVILTAKVATAFTEHLAMQIDPPVDVTKWAGTAVVAGAIPAVAADGEGGLPISDAGGLDLDNRMPASGTVTNLDTLYDGVEGFAPAYMGPRGPGVYLNDAAANTNTVNGVDGTWSNPVSTIAAAKTLADSLSVDRIYLVNDSAITLAAAMENYEFVGIGEMSVNTINLGSQDVDNSYFENVLISGAQGGTSRIKTEGCVLSVITGMELTALNCILAAGTLTLRDDCAFISCSSAVAGGGTPILDINSVANVNVYFRDSSGGLQVNNAVSTTVMSYDCPAGQLVVGATCTSLTVHIRGNCSITDNGTTTNLTQDAAVNRTNINAECDTALNTAIPGSPTADSINERVAALDERLTAARAGYLDKLNITGNVAASGEVTAIQNNTRVRVIVPPAIERPDSGSTAYKLHLYIYDLEGNMEAPDSAPTIAAENEAGTDRSGNLGTVTLESAGHYSVTYTGSSSHAIEQLLFEWTVVEGGATRYHGVVAQIVDTTAVDFTSADRTKLDTLHDSRLTAARAGKLDNLDATVSSRSSHTAANVWSAGTRTLTSFGTLVSAIWSNAARRITGFLGADLTETSGGRIAGNMSTFWDNADAATTKTVDDVGGGAGSGETQSHSGTAQGGTANTITLDVGASATNDLYKHAKLAITAGTGAGQGQIIDSYVGSTRVATMAAPWVITPDATSVFVILPLGTIPGASAPSAAVVADAVWDEARGDHQSTGSTGEKLNQLPVNVVLGAIQTTVQPGNRTGSPIRLEMFQLEAKTFLLAVLDASGDPVDLSGRTLRFVVHDDGTPPAGVFDVEDAEITVSGTNNEVANVLVNATQSVSALANHKWRLWDVTSEEVLLHGPFTIKRAAKDVT